MSEFTENFNKRWAKSFGEDKLVQKPMPPGIYPEDFQMPLEKQEPVSILRRIWNDAVLGGGNRLPALETPAPVSWSRSIGRFVGGASVVGAIGWGIASAYIPGVAAIPVISALFSIAGLTSLAGGIRGIFTQPKPHEPVERLVHTERGAGVRNYDMITEPAKPTTLGDKISHVIDHASEGFQLPYVGVYRAINTPIRLAGYAAHAFDTALKTYNDLYDKTEEAAKETPEPPDRPQDFTP